MAISSYPSGFRGGALLKEVPLFDSIAGNVYWVDSGTGGAGNPGTFTRPLSTLDGAINKCTANNGDYIFIKPGHSEAIAAAGVVMDVAGVTVVGLGSGSDQPQIRFTAATSDIDISAANCTFRNIRFTAAAADVAGGFDIAAAATDTAFIECRFDEETTDENWVVVMDVVTACDGLVIQDCTYIGGDASNDSLVVFAGTHARTKIIGNVMMHTVAQTAAAAFITSATQQAGIVLADNLMHTEVAVATSAAFVVLTGTTNYGFALRNHLSSVDNDLAAAEVLASFDVSGLHSVGNTFQSGVADTYAITDSWLTVENLT